MANRTITILVVDDDQDIIKQVAVMLKSPGIKLQVASNTNDAVEAFQQIWPDLVFLDINIPEHEGWLVCSKLKLSGDSPTIVLITGRTECDRDRFDAFANADRVLRKPFFEKDLLRIVSQVNSAVPSDETRC